MSAMKSVELRTGYHYIRLAIAPALPDALVLRKTLETAMRQSFGAVRAATYMDVLWLAADGREAVVRVGTDDAAAVCGAVVALAGDVRLSVVLDAPFLPAILADRESWTAPSTDT